MRLGLVSDTHDRLDRTIRAVALLEAAGAQGLIHCGDLTGPAIVRACARLGPSYFVFGNNDFDRPTLRRTIADVGGTCLERGGIVELAGRRLGVTHGDVAREFRALVRAQPDYLVFGHTHLMLNERDGPTRQINPGALHRAAQWTVALLDLTADAVEFLQIVESAHRHQIRLP